ncbi:MAG: hypothetical protein US20_C0023G0002 [Candidatus Pacebacteria bacterium GW2011_GWF1_36_5]|nr:MAG: hypothetical protein US20_C0023G0002 [Candidatus Pacebacteria bacterium GW2011_GWF1_36_5]
MKAVIFDKEGKLLEVIKNVKSYTEQNIYGDSVIEGLSQNVTFKIFADDAEINIDSQDIKPNEDLKKAKLAQIEELKQKAAGLDYVILKRYREEKLGKKIDKTDDDKFIAKLQEQEGYIQEIRQLGQELLAL